MLWVGPDHPSYRLLSELTQAVRAAWQEGFEHARHGAAKDNPYHY